MSLLFLVLHLLGGVRGGGPVSDPSGSVGQVYQRVHTISPSLLNVQSFSIIQTLKNQYLIFRPLMIKDLPTSVISKYNMFDIRGTPALVICDAILTTNLNTLHKPCVTLLN